MTELSAAVALAARGHERDGRILAGPAVRDDLRAAAAAIGESSPEILAGPSDVVHEDVLVLPLASPDAVLPVMLTIAAAMRPAKTTFCAAVMPRDREAAAPAGDSLDGTLLAADHAATEATAGITETDVRDSRALVLTPEPDPMLGALLDIILEAYDSMTDRQRQIVDLVKDSETQQQVATHLGISRQAVNQSLTAARWPHLRQAQEAVLNRLASLTTGDPDWRSVRA